jgi:site-specific DNA-methyltransferase (adenine-specific)
MRPAEWRAFLEDVRERGMLEPLRVAADGSTVLDGRHRLKAAAELGLVEVPVAPAGCDVADEAAYMLRAAIHRRHLTDDQRAILAARLAEALGSERRRDKARVAIRSRWEAAPREVALDTRGITPVPGVSGEPKAREIAARELGVSERRLRVARELGRTAPDLAARVEAGTLPLLVAKTEAARRSAIQELRAGPPAELPQGAEIWQGDAFELARKIPDESVDLILTDPPYTSGDTGIWEPLGALAERVLRPGGWLLCHVGTMDLPAELAGLCSSGLEWWWMAALVLPGGPHAPAVRARRVRNGWQAIAILRKPGPNPPTIWFSDVILPRREGEKDLHPWQKALDPGRRLIRRFSLPGQMVLDPFCGSGTFPAAAALEGRRPLGIELDVGHAETARQRVAAAADERAAASLSAITDALRRAQAELAAGPEALPVAYVAGLYARLRAVLDGQPWVGAKGISG